MITHVAIKVDGGRIWSLPSPNRHDNVFKEIAPEDVCLGSEFKVGFLNDAGVFLTREAAWHEAKRCNQILPPYNPIDPSQRRGTPTDIPGPLFSEDIW